MNKFLLVEDDPKISELLIGWIENLYPNCNVQHTSFGKKGLEIYRQDQIDMVMLDYLLPDINGIEFLQKVQQDNVTAPSPIIMLTSADDEVVAVNSFKHGATDYLSKKNLTLGALERSIIYTKNIIDTVHTQNQIQKRLEKSEARYRDLIENANDLIQNIHPDGRLIYANKAWENLLGYDAKQFKDQSFLDIVHPNSKASLISIIEKIVSTKESQENIEFDLITKNNIIVTVEGHLQAEQELHKTLSIACIFRNITPRKLIEQELKEDKQLFEVTLRSIGEAVISTDNDSCINFMNPIAEQLTGWNISQAQGKKIDEVMQIFFEGSKVPMPCPVSACLKQEAIATLPESALLVSRDGTEYLITL